MVTATFVYGGVVPLAEQDQIVQVSSATGDPWHPMVGFGDAGFGDIPDSGTCRL
jgi:hypothetical protein